MRTFTLGSRSFLFGGAAVLGVSVLAMGIATSPEASAATAAGAPVQATAAVTEPTPKPTVTPTPMPVHHSKPALKSVTIRLKVSGKVTGGVYRGMLVASLAEGKTMPSGQVLTLHARHDAKAAWKSVGHAVTAAKTGKVTFVLTQRSGTEQYEVTFAGTAKYAHATSAVITVKRR